MLVNNNFFLRAAFSFLKSRHIAIQAALMALVHTEPDSLEEADVPGHESLEGLAELWEGIFAVRQRTRRVGGLLEWPSVESTGIPSMTLECINSKTLCMVQFVWGVGFT